MPSKYTYTEVEGQKLKLSNLQKLIYPNAGIIKAEIIQYYLAVQNKLLQFSANRPLTLIRYPDGIEAHKFYARNKPDWTPDWIKTDILPWDNENEYLFLSNAASLAWLANLAALEIHIMGSRNSNVTKPDHFVIDMDPSEEFGFNRLKEVAHELKGFLESLDLVPFIKTSGGKGLHILVPVEVKLEYKEQIDKIKELLKPFLKAHKHCTLKISKEKRKGKVLLDIYRNHQGNTTICPYSLRGKLNAPVSVPFEWEELDKIQKANQFHLKNLNEWIDQAPSWDSFFDKARPLDINTKKSIPVNLESYEQKRNFTKTNEPPANKDESVNGKFVINLHDATNLHYDLRLGIEGVLKSWAIPKGMPLTKGIKRLAIQTEDHPAKYLNFEGEIPKDEYGGGRLWIFDTGTYQLIQSKKDKKYQIQLSGKLFKGKYDIYKMKDNQWLTELKSDEDFTMPVVQSKHMLAEMTDKIPSGKKWIYEVKWDGIRVFIIKKNDSVQILSRSGKDLSKKFPEITDPDLYETEEIILDGEIVVLDDQGRPLFNEVISRMHSQFPPKKLNATFYAFDLIYVDGKDCTNEPIENRRAYIPHLIKIKNAIRFSESFESGQSLFDAIKMKNMEGIMAKKSGSKYFFGQRSAQWLKYKVRHNTTCYVIGYTKGKGDRSAYFGSMHLAQKENDKWIYRGRVGTGFDMDQLKSIFSILRSIPKAKKLLKQKIEEERNTTWIKPQLEAEIIYASKTPNETFREPVFVKFLK